MATPGEIFNKHSTASGFSTTLATALDEDTDAISSYDKAPSYTTVSADGVVSASPVVLYGYYVSASSSGVISFYDNATAGTGTTIIATSKSVAANDIVTLPKGVVLANGLYFDLVSGTATVHVLTRKVTTQ